MTSDRSEKPPEARWEAEVVAGDAAELHAMDVPEKRFVRFHSLEHAAVVLGSTQNASQVIATDVDEHEVQIASRRSGGGAVWLAPGEQIWVDVVIPRDDPLWIDDVSRAGLWLGNVWVQALEAGSVWDGPVVGAHGSTFCFAGLAPGEVFLPTETGPVKILGVSQRRTSKLARFQCVAYLEWNPQRIQALMRGAHTNTDFDLDQHGQRATSAGEWELADAFMRALPS